MSKQKYRITFKCSCGKVFKKITTNPDLDVATCPSCKAKEKKTRFHRMGDGAISDEQILKEKLDAKLREDPEYQAYLKEKASKRWGDSPETKNKIKAIDETAKMCMEDYHLGDIKDTSHVGETVAPKLAPRLQKQVDSFFQPHRGGNMGGINTAGLARAAMSGAYRPGGSSGSVDPVRMAQAQKQRVSPNVIASFDGVK